MEHALWGIGRTGVMCYMEPCPRRGIFPVSADGQERGFPISRLDQPEPHFVSADPFVTQSVATAYSDGSCLVVEARRIGDGLDILRIVGQC